MYVSCHIKRCLKEQKKYFHIYPFSFANLSMIILNKVWSFKLKLEPFYVLIIIPPSFVKPQPPCVDLKTLNWMQLHMHIHFLNMFLMIFFNTAHILHPLTHSIHAPQINSTQNQNTYCKIYTALTFNLLNQKLLSFLS